MNCTEVKELLSCYYDGELATADGERVVAHLKQCADCAQDLARFGQLSALTRELSPPPSAPADWKHYEKQLVRESHAEPPSDSASNGSSLSRSWRPSGRRPLLALAALLLIAAGWFAIEAWLGNGSHTLLAADIRQYVEQFERDPQAAQRMLLNKYDGQPLALEEALRQVSYEPVVADGLPPQYTVNAMYLLKMPCCDCLQTVCQRSDGSQFVIFEYGEEKPVSTADRPSGMATCCGEDCCLMQINELFTTSWKKGERQISLVGMTNQAEANALAAALR